MITEPLINRSWITAWCFLNSVRKKQSITDVEVDYLFLRKTCKNKKKRLCDKWFSIIPRSGGYNRVNEIARPLPKGEKAAGKAKLVNVVILKISPHLLQERTFPISKLLNFDFRTASPETLSTPFSRYYIWPILRTTAFVTLKNCPRERIRGCFNESDLEFDHQSKNEAGSKTKSNVRTIELLLSPFVNSNQGWSRISQRIHNWLRAARSALALSSIEMSPVALGHPLIVSFARDQPSLTRSNVLPGMMDSVGASFFISDEWAFFNGCDTSWLKSYRDMGYIYITFSEF